IALTWGVPVAATVRAWWAKGRRGQGETWVWTELAAVADIVAAALLFVVVGLNLVGPQGPADLVRQASWVAGGGLVSWWITGRAGVGNSASAQFTRTIHSTREVPTSCIPGRS